MIDLLSGLTTFQWVLIAGGAFFLFPLVRDFVTKLRSVDTVDVPDTPVNITTDDDLTSIVHKWERLYDACVRAGLEDARKKLQEVFPLFALDNAPETTNE